MLLNAFVIETIALAQLDIIELNISLGISDFVATGKSLGIVLGEYDGTTEV